MPPAFSDLAPKPSTPSSQPLSQAERRKLVAQLQTLQLQAAERNCYFWLTQMTETIDEQDNVRPYKPFPAKAYIEHTIPILMNEETVFIPKSRSMMASWTLAGAALWKAMTRPATGVIIQSRDEQRAKKLIDYARTLYERSDPEWKRLHPLEKPLAAQRETELRLANDSYLKAIVGTSDAARSEHPTIFIADEAAFMDECEECLNTSRAAKPLHMWAISSANKGPFFDMLETAVPCDWGGHPAPDKRGAFDHFRGAAVKRPTPGLTFGRTKNGWAVIEMHYGADPERNAAWVAKAKLGYSSEADWNKEQEINPYAKDGSIVFPDFDQSIHVIPHSQIPPRLTRYMAIDPHPRTPHAFLWVGIDRWGDWYFYRELWPSIVCGRAEALKDNDVENRFKIRDYAETVAHMEGNDLNWHYPETDDESGEYKQNRNGENIVGRYMDQAGKGFTTGGDAAESESYWARYTRYGMFLLEPKKQHELGYDAIHEGLRPRFHDQRGTWPKFHISDRCPELILELRRYRFKNMGRFNPDKELPQVGVEARCHFIDLMRYLATAPITNYPSQESPEWKNFQ